LIFVRDCWGDTCGNWGSAYCYFAKVLTEDHTEIL